MRGPIDLLLPLLYAGYGIALLMRLRHGADSVVLAPLDSGAVPSGRWRTVALLLMASALSDVLITLAMSAGRPDFAGPVVVLFTSAVLLGLGVLSLLRSDSAVQAESSEDGAVDPAATGKRASARSDAFDGAEAVEIVARARSLLAEQQLYRDPDLTLARLARRLTLPAKRLSAAINAVEPCNVSRFVNRHRIDHACRELSHNGGRVTEAMLDAGFRTKSNFNREFLPVCGCSPSEWVAKQASDERASQA